MQLIRILFCLLFILSAQANAYLIKDIESEGYVLVLDDGSEWDIKYFGGAWRLVGFGWTEQEQVSHWTPGDAIQVEFPDSGNITDFILDLHNLSRKQHALATLKKAPSINCSVTLWVVDCVQIHETNPKHSHELKLSDGTVWRITNDDMYGSALYHQPNHNMNWQAGDILTLIREPNLIFTNKNYLLWNHQTNQMPYADKVEIVNQPLPDDHFKNHCSRR